MIMYSNKKTVSLMTTAGVILAMSSLFLTGSVFAPNTGAFAAKVNEQDFELVDFGIDDDGNPFMTVEGKAGGTKSTDAEVIYAYVFVTNDGIYAVTSHGGEDSEQVEVDSKYHTHLIELDGDNCITHIEDAGNVKLKQDTVTLTETDASELDAVKAVKLTVNNGNVCVDQVFSELP